MADLLFAISNTALPVEPHSAPAAPTLWWFWDHLGLCHPHRLAASAGTDTTFAIFTPLLLPAMALFALLVAFLILFVLLHFLWWFSL